MPLALAWSFITVYLLISWVLPWVIEVTESYHTLTCLTWAINVPYFFKLAMAFLLNPFLKRTGDSLIDPGELAIKMSNWEIILVIMYFWVIFSLLSKSIAAWAKASGEVIQKLWEIAIVFTEQHCQDYWGWTKRGVYRYATITLILAPVLRFLPVHLLGISALASLSALVQLNPVAFIFFVLAVGFVTLWLNLFSDVPFGYVAYINQVYASRNDLLRLANKLKTEREFNEYIRNPHKYEIKE